jgi:L,D-transpeptidase catalytic domain
MNTAAQEIRGQRSRARVSGIGALAIVVTVALASPVSAKIRHQPEPKPIERVVSKGPFGDVPKGTMQIVVSINQQKLHLYSDGKEVAETSVATGVPQLPTPTGVFSVIQKQRFHRSNIYSGAPMPFMQRITWSGVAIHEGENIGHPASHGCIRMPHDFAVRLFDFTKVGVRVIVAREELKPVDIADPHLFMHKAAPPPAPAPEAAAAPTSAAATPTSTEATPAADPTRTADAGMAPKTDAPGVAAAPAPAAAAATAADASKATATGAQPQATSADAPAPKEEATKPANAIAGGDGKVADSVTPAQTDAAAPAATAPEATKTAPAAETKMTDAAPPSMPQPAAPTPTEQLRGTLTGGTAPGALDVPAPAAKPPALVEAAAATHGPIAVFISRKTQKLYVRQNFAPLFEAPITVAQPDQPVGTLVFTAMNYLSDGATFRWNVVIFPGEPPRVKRVVETRRGRRTIEEAAKPTGTLPPPQTPAEVLARVQIPQEVLDRVSELMVPGSSLVVSDQGLGDETGEGTDFIVVTR